jgi:NADH-quinone oxidoreductase subunit E
MKHLIPEFDKLRARFPLDMTSSLVLPCLHLIQEDRGYIGADDIDGLVGYLNVPRIQIEEVLSFYSEYRQQPTGRWHLQVCRNVSCSMRGAERLLAHLAGKLGIKEGETTPDGRFTLSTVECLGSCGTAPVMMVNGAYQENLSAEKVDAMLKDMA